MRASLAVLGLLVGCGGGGTASFGPGNGPVVVSGAGGSSSTSTSSTSVSSGGGAGGAGGSAQPCVASNECPGPEDECAWRLCDEGSCSVGFAPTGTPVANQVAYDCTTNVCDGAGNIVPQLDPADATSDDDDCTADRCTSSGVTHDPEPTGTACAQDDGHLCQGGACVPYIPVSCFTGAFLLVSCDGASHVEGDITWEGGTCTGVATDVGYCAPGTPCVITWQPSGFDVAGVCQ